MRTPKIYALNNLIDWLNFKFEGLNIPKKLINNSPLLSNAWLSGFIEADGHFSVRTTTISKYPRVACKFELSFLCEAYFIESGKSFMKIIANYLEIPDYSFKQKKISNCFKLHIKTQNIRSNELLAIYLNSFPLYSSKYLNFQDFLLVLEIYKKLKINKKLGCDFDSLDLNKIKIIKERMLNRTSFN